MESGTSFRNIEVALCEREGEALEPNLKPLLRELWLYAESAVEAQQFEHVEEVAIACIEALEPPSVAVDKVLHAGRALVEVVEGTECLDEEGTARLRRLVDRAAIEVARAVEAGRSGRRSAWLSFLSHELKNPLNTIVNALWLLRERSVEGPQAARFIELAERAVKKLEERIRDLKALDQQLGTLPPGWEGRLVPKRK